MTVLYPETLDVLKRLVSQPDPSGEIRVKGHSLEALTCPFADCTDLETELASLLGHALELLREVSHRPWQEVSEFESVCEDALLEPGTYELVFRYEDGREELVARTYQISFTTKTFGMWAHRFRLTTAMKDFQPEPLPVEVRVGKYDLPKIGIGEVVCITGNMCCYKFPTGGAVIQETRLIQASLTAHQATFIEEVAE